MGIVIRHDAAGVPASNDKSRFSAGMQMVARQQAADNNLRLERMAPLKYDTTEVYGSSKAQKLNPSKGIANQEFGADPSSPPMPLTSASDLMGVSPQQRNQALMANIDAGMYTPEQRKAIRELVSRQTKLMTSRDLNEAQKQGAMDQFNSDFEKLLPTLPELPTTSVAMRSGQQARKMDALQTFQTKPEVFKDFLSRVDAEADRLNVTYDNRLRMQRAKELWEEQDAFLSGTSTVSNPYRENIGADANQLPLATQTVTQVAAPNRSPRKQPIYFNPGSSSVTNTGRSPIYNEQGSFVGDPSLYDSAGAKNIRQQAGLEAPPSSMRKWTSNDGRYSTEGEMIGFRATQGGDPLSSEMVRIRKKNGVEVDVPLHRLSEEDRQMVTASPQYDYQIRNQRIGGSPTGSNYQQMFDPNNPEYAEMRAPLQQQTQNEGSFVGRYGMGGVDYGVNSTTGNRVTASVRPGGTTLQYDEPVKVHPKVTNRTIDEVMTKAARAKRQQASEEFDRQFPNAIGNPIDISASIAGKILDDRMKSAKDDSEKREYSVVKGLLAQGQSPPIMDAIATAYDPGASRDDKKKALAFLVQNGVDLEELVQKQFDAGKFRPSGVIPMGDAYNRQFVREPKY